MGKIYWNKNQMAQEQIYGYFQIHHCPSQGLAALAKEITMTFGPSCRVPTFTHCGNGARKLRILSPSEAECWSSQNNSLSSILRCQVRLQTVIPSGQTPEPSHLSHRAHISAVSPVGLPWSLGGHLIPSWIPDSLFKRLIQQPQGLAHLRNLSLVQEPFSIRDNILRLMPSPSQLLLLFHDFVLAHIYVVVVWWP